VCFGDLTEALASSALLEDRNPVDVERPPADMPAFQSGTAHTRPHPLDDEISLEFGDGPDDDDNGPPQRTSGIKIFTEAYELDVEMIEFVQHLEEVSDGSGDPIRGPDQQHLKAAAARISEQVIETRSTSFSPGDPVGVLGNDLKTSLLGHRAKIVELRLRVLIDTRYAQIKGNSFHICSSSDARSSFNRPYRFGPGDQGQVQAG
jgi:hypothetical protein